MKWVLYLIILATALLVPVKKNNVGDLQPMEVLYICTEKGVVVLKTDTEDLGIGATVSEAVKNLHATTPGIVYLDTADYLIVNENAENQIGELREYLKPSVRVCMTKEEIDLISVAKYLSIHRPGVKIENGTDSEMIENLYVENGRINLKENS